MQEWKTLMQPTILYDNFPKHDVRTDSKHKKIKDKGEDTGLLPQA